MEGMIFVKNNISYIVLLTSNIQTYNGIMQFRIARNHYNTKNNKLAFFMG